MTPDDLDIHDMVRQLTSTHWSREPIPERNPDGSVGDRQGHHGTTLPSLVDQLVEASDSTTGSGAERGALRSKPAARIEAMDVVWLIDFEAGDWLYRLGEPIPGDDVDDTHKRTPIPGSGTKKRILRLGGLYPSAPTCGREKGRHLTAKSSHFPCCTRGHLEYVVKGWWSQARIVSGWDSPAFRPNAACPACNKVGGLRVKLTGATCLKCNTVWGAGEVGILGEAIRLELDQKLLLTQRVQRSAR